MEMLPTKIVLTYRVSGTHLVCMTKYTLTTLKKLENS